MGRRLELHELLCETLGSRNVPPKSVGKDRETLRRPRVEKKAGESIGGATATYATHIGRQRRPKKPVFTAFVSV